MMLAISSPTMFSNNMKWPLDLQEEEVSHFNSEDFPLLHQQFSSSSMTKKLNHNASERHRRKKINALYSSLRSLLPLSDQTKKMSIPATISRVLKYIPELQQQVEDLIKKKEELLLRISQQGAAVNNKKESVKKGKGHHHHHHNSACDFLVSSSRLSQSEVTIQIISSPYDGIHKCPLSEILVCLENQYGLELLNASSFETLGGRLFYNLVFQMEKSDALDSEIVREKILSICEKHQRIMKDQIKYLGFSDTQLCNA